MILMLQGLWMNLDSRYLNIIWIIFQKDYRNSIDWLSNTPLTSSNKESVVVQCTHTAMPSPGSLEWILLSIWTKMWSNCFVVSWLFIHLVNCNSSCTNWQWKTVLDVHSAAMGENWPSHNLLGFQTRLPKHSQSTWAVHLNKMRLLLNMHCWRRSNQNYFYMNSIQLKNGKQVYVHCFLTTNSRSPLR